MAKFKFPGKCFYGNNRKKLYAYYDENEVKDEFGKEYLDVLAEQTKESYATFFTENKSRTMNIGNLPDEILLTVFSYIKQRELLTTVAKVCERWNNLSFDKVSWKHVFCAGNGVMIYAVEKSPYVTVDQFLLLAENGIKAESIEMRDCSEEEVRSVFECCIKNRMPIKQIKFSDGTEYDPYDVNELSTSDISTTVSDINVESNLAFEAGVLCFKTFRNIEKFACPVNLHDKFKSMLSTHFKKLQELVLTGVCFPKVELVTIVNNLQELKSVKFVSCIVNKNVGFQPFEGNKTLKCIDVEYTSASGNEDDSVLDYLPIVTLPTLEILRCDFHDSKFNPTWILSHASQSIKSMELKGHSANWNNIYMDEVLQIIGIQLPQLHTFTLKSFVTDKGLADFLKNAKNLQKLSIHNTADYPLPERLKVNGDDWIQVAVDHPSLMYLDVSKCQYLKEVNKQLLISSVKPGAKFICS